MPCRPGYSPASPAAQPARPRLPAAAARWLTGENWRPLAVESTSPRPGFLPFNKFSVVPLLVRVSRLAQDESMLPNDVRKRFMALDNTHVIGLDIAGDRITRILTSRGNLDVPANGLVFLGLGTIENTRMALNTLDRARGYDPHQLIGRNLMAHLRSNLPSGCRAAPWAKPWT
jgi:hypothetical protein